MKKVKFNVMCRAVYQTELAIPEEIANNKDAILVYIRDHLDEVPTTELEWVGDFEPYDAVTRDDIKSIY